MLEEMSRQPDVLAALAGRFDELCRQVGSVTVEAPRGVAFLARGSSDHAALLGRYAVELYAGLPTSLVAPSLVTAHRHRPVQYAGWLVVAFSQSGRTPEIVDVAAQAAQAGAKVVAVTNDAGSDLAGIADLTVDLAAGEERAVPATKTVTAQMVAALIVASGVSGSGLTQSQAAQIPDAVAAVLMDRSAIDPHAPIRRGVAGPGLATGRAPRPLKARGPGSGARFSTADFRHGRRRCPRRPAVAPAPDDDTRALRSDLADRHARATLLGTGPDAASSWPALGHAGECVLATVRGQQLAYGIATARGIDPDAPAGLHKVTLTH